MTHRTTLATALSLALAAAVFTTPVATAAPLGGGYIAASSATSAKKVTTTNLNMRTGNTVAHKVILTIPKGKTVTFSSVASNGWNKITYAGKIGWASGAYLKKASTSSSTATTKTSTSSSITKTTRYTTASLNMRTGTSTSNKTIKVMPKGAKITTTASKNGWYKVSYAGKTGWASGKYMTTKKPVVIKSGTKVSTSTIKAKYSNGRLPSSALCSVNYDTKQKMTCAARADWYELNAAFKKKFGHNIPLDLSYRTYSEQVNMRARFGSQAAVPGTSNHGWGTAIDLPDYRFSKEGKQYVFGATKYEWLKKNAPTYNWNTPKWAQKGGSNPEPWHFEYLK